MDNVLRTADRQKAASLLSKWLGERITNWQFEDQWPEDSQDRAVVDIGRFFWCFYSDFPEKPLRITDLSPEGKRVLERAQIFLETDADYVPVQYSEVFPWKPNLLTRLFRVKERPWETMKLNIPPEREKW